VGGRKGKKEERGGEEGSEGGRGKEVPLKVPLAMSAMREPVRSSL
jgi:hypothetical protein